MRLFYCIIACLLISFIVFSDSLFGQNPVPIYRGNSYEANLHNTLFIDAEGNVVFQLYPSIRLVKYHPTFSAGYNGFIDEFLNQSLDPYYNDICVTVSGGNRFRNYYWIDKTGKTVKDFGIEFREMGRFINGYVMAERKQKSGQRYVYSLVYLNKQGENAFGNKEFWDAVPFSEGMAGVQPKEGGDWSWIDETGEIVLKPKNIDNSQIVQLHGFSDGLGKVILKDPYRYWFVNTDGDTVLKLDSVFSKKKIVDSGYFHEGLLKVSLSRSKEGGAVDIYYINKSGDIVHKFEKVAKASDVVDDLFYVKTRTPINKYEYHSEILFFDTEGNSIKLNIPESLKITSVYNFGRKMMQLHLANDQISFNAIYSREKNQIIGTSENEILGFTNHLFLSYDFHDKYYQLLNFKGETVWDSDISKRVFTDISEALKIKEKVGAFKSTNKSDFRNGILELKNLERLEINNIDTIPSEIEQLKNLKQLTILFFKNLGTIPNNLANLPKLEKIHIHYCENYEGGLETIVKNSQSLKRLTITGMKLPIDFKEKIKQINPKLYVRVSQPDDNNMPVESDPIEVEID